MSKLETNEWLSILKLVGWGLIISVSIILSATSSENELNQYGILMLLANLIPMMVIYIINSSLFIPHLLFRDEKIWFFIANVALLFGLLLFEYYIGERKLIAMLNLIEVPPVPEYRKDKIFLVRDLFNFILMIGFVTSVNLMGRLQRSEEALREAENARIKAELSNLRSQLNPHFLLNTLNNIYALTAIDSDMAQKAIKELSHLLRYVLYDNLSDKVLLIKEVEFLQNYIELMRIRLNKQVRLIVESNVTPECSTQIAPLIFISLIENAFKHGVSAEADSFIEIKIDNNITNNEVTLSICNSNHAKTSNDKSGRGIGLDQVRRRLEIQYPSLYEWSIDDTAERYSSTLTLKNS
ncbi:MAG: sensor histidine kinase [Rikenellaceae bacterium]